MDTGEFSDRLRELREAQSLSLSEVARRAQISKAYLSQLEHGGSTQPSYSIVTRLSTALATTVGHLIGDPGTWDPASHETIPAALRAFADRTDLPEVDINMLAKIHFRGKRPKGPDDWAHLYETIKRTIR